MDTAKFFANSQHANDYLSGSIILLEKEPIVVRSVHADNNIVYDPLKGYGNHARSKRVGLNNPALYFGTVPLGYCLEAYGSACYRLSRVAARQWKVGITRNTVRTNPAGIGLGLVGGRINYEDSGLYDCIVGNYPAPDEAIKKLDPQERLSTPIGRYIALQCPAPSEPGIRVIHYRSNSIVGFLRKNTIYLHPDKFYLIESLQALGFACEVRNDD